MKIKFVMSKIINEDLTLKSIAFDGCIFEDIDFSNVIFKNCDLSNKNFDNKMLRRVVLKIVNLWELVL